MADWRFPLKRGPETPGTGPGQANGSVNLSTGLKRMHDKFLPNPRVKTSAGSWVKTHFHRNVMESVHRFHSTLPVYRTTPLYSMENLADYLGISHLWVKDESSRFGLSAFKGLGVSYAMDRLLQSRSDRSPGASPVWVTATDGNHGHAVAWSARRLGHEAVVFGPQNMPARRIEQMKSLGARVTVIRGNYDDAVRLARLEARRKGWLLLQDTAASRRETVPLWIMQGYTTLVSETLKQLRGSFPTHVFVQCGVGSLAGAVTAAFSALFGEGRPQLFVAEAGAAACYFQSVLRNDGRSHAVRGDMETIMAGLACGRASSLAWPVLRDLAHGFFSCSEATALEGMNVFRKPLNGDPVIHAGESGAVTLGLLLHLAHGSPEMGAFSLSPSSRVLIIVTEGPAGIQEIPQ